jgi:hypothetical protein
MTNSACAIERCNAPTQPPAIGTARARAVLPLELADSMKIAQIAPLIESVPPRFYGGTERVVSYLTEELVRLGHDVTLFASGDSVTSARLVSCATTALRLDPKVLDPIPYLMLMLDRVRELRRRFRYLALPYRSVPFSAVSTARRPYPDNRTRPTRFTGFATALFRLQ